MRISQEAQNMNRKKLKDVGSGYQVAPKFSFCRERALKPLVGAGPFRSTIYFSHLAEEATGGKGRVIASGAGL